MMTDMIRTTLLLVSLLFLGISGLIVFGMPAASATPVSIYDGTVTLEPGTSFWAVPYNEDHLSDQYEVSYTTPLGALHAASLAEGFTYDVTDKRWSYDQVLLLDNIHHDGTDYNYNSPGKWYAYVNGAYKDGYSNHPDGLNVFEVAHGDHVDFYYASGVTPTDFTAVQAAATAAITTVVSTGGPPPGWSLSLSGARSQAISQSYFEEGLACPSSGHNVTWTDTDGSVYSGVPLWFLVGIVDDNPDAGPLHFNFNDALAAQGYSVEITSADGWSTTLASADIARNDGYIVADKLNGSALPLLTPGGKRSYPLHLKGSAVNSGQSVGNITKIELIGLPGPVVGWTLTMEGDVTDVISQALFEGAIACVHNATYTDGSGVTWTGVPLWDLAGTVDDIETTNHWTFNDTLVTTPGYTIRVINATGANATVASTGAAHSNGYLVAFLKNGTALTGEEYPLKLVGSATTDDAQRVGNITRIRLEGLPSAPSGDYNLTLKGRISDVLPQAEFEALAACHPASYTNATGYAYTGTPLWRILGWVDDRIPHGPHGFNDTAAEAGYTVIVKAGDGYAVSFTSKEIMRNENFIVANTLNGSAIPPGAHGPGPLRLVGANVTGGKSVGFVSEIQLTDFEAPQGIPSVHVVKYGEDGVTIINETTVDYQWMEGNLTVYGDGTTHYYFEGITNNPEDIWDANETYPGGMKVDNAVKGTAVRDLVDLVGGMGPGTDVKLIASDGYETTLGYPNVYPNGTLLARQGEAILAWYADGQHVPYYGDGYRLFFIGSDHIFSQWDMHECIRPSLWHYYTQAYPPGSPYYPSVTYPSCAGMSAKFIRTIRVYSVPETEWTLALDGRNLTGGINFTVTKGYFEEALACQFGADHKVSYTNGEGTWEGMPLWFLVGAVDDADPHTSSAYNETKALAGYDIVITGDGNATTIDSRDTVRNANYIVANTLNGHHLDDENENWPLRLVGPNVTAGMAVKNITSIALGQPDLLFAKVTAPKSAEKGAKVAVAYTIQNNGTTGVRNNTTTRVYLSKDKTITPADKLLGSRNEGPLQSGISRKVTAKVKIPAATKPGTYYIGVIADAANNVTESSEANNAKRAAKALKVTAG